MTRIRYLPAIPFTASFVLWIVGSSFRIHKVHALQTSFTFSKSPYLATRRFASRTRLMDVPHDTAFVARTPTAIEKINEARYNFDPCANGCTVPAEDTRVFPAAVSLDPASIEIIPRCDSLIHNDEKMCLVSSNARTMYPFVNMIRDSAPYIAGHRNNLAVFHIPGELLEWDGFTDLMDDIALTRLLGLKIVLVVGCRHQVDDRMEKYFNFDKTKRGDIRITDYDTLRVVEEEAGYVRFEVERQLNRCLRLHGGYDAHSDGPPAPNGNVVSGNFFSAQPFGVVNGVNYKYTGYPRHINVNRIKKTVASNDVVLLTPIGVSATGDVLNVNSESLAAFVAGSLKANKIIFCSTQGMVLRNKATKKNVQNFRLRDAQSILQHFKIKVHRNFFVTSKDERKELTPAAMGMLLKIGWASRALESGVERAHIVAPKDGALIEELFTAKAGTGTCISQDLYESAHPDDDSGDFDHVGADMNLDLKLHDPPDLVNHFNTDYDLVPEYPRRVMSRDFPWG